MEIHTQPKYPIQDWDEDYLLQHRSDVKTLLDHLELFVKQRPSEMIVLDSGAGHGMHAGFMSQYFAQVYSTDIISYSTCREGQLFSYIAQEFEKRSFDLDLDRLHLLYSDATDLVSKDNLFDLVVSINCFEHIPSPDRALDEMIRCTKPGGYINIEFDPFWTADTGSHFAQLVPEPWAHLVYSEDEFLGRMRDAGAEEWEMWEFSHAMNRKRPDYFWSLFEKIQNADIVHQTTPEQWSGVVDNQHLNHPFFEVSQTKGYSKEELLVRGMRLLIIKRG